MNRFNVRRIADPAQEGRRYWRIPFRRLVNWKLFSSHGETGFRLLTAEVMINTRLTIGEVQQQTTVSADVAGIDETTSTINGSLPEKSLAELSLDNRDLFSAVALEPGVAPDPSSAPSILSSGKAGQVSVNGIGPSMTDVLIDGIDATDPVWGYSPAGASGFFLANRRSWTAFVRASRSADVVEFC